MSYNIELLHPITKEVLKLDNPHFMTGGTYALGGTTEMHLNVTYNYAPHYYRLIGDKGIRTIYGMTAIDSIPLLSKAIEQLKDDVVENYWEPTEGNAKMALIQLVTLAKMRPDGIWDGD